MSYKKTLVAILLIAGLFSGATASKAASAPNITKPSARAVVNLNNPPQLDWDSVSGATKYDIQIRCSDCGYDMATPDLQKSYITGGWRFTVSKSEFSLPENLKDNLYRFRVRARLSSGGYTPYSSYRYFSIKGQGSDIGEGSSVGDEGFTDAPTILTPRDEQVLTNYPRKADLSWTRVTNARKYEIELACDVCVSTKTKWKNPSTYYSTTNNYKTSPLAGDNEFRFRVRAILNDGSKSSWSRYQYFTYNTSNQKSELTVTASKSEISITETVRITATSKHFGDISKIEIYVNGALSKTCSAVETCSYTAGPFSAHYNGKVSYYARAYRYGENRPSIYSSTEYISVKDKFVTPTLQVRSSDSNVSVNDDEIVTLTAETNNGTALDKIELYVNGSRQYTCYDESKCSDTVNTLLYTNQGSVNYYAIGYIDATNQKIYSSTKTITIQKDFRHQQPTITSPYNDSEFSGDLTSIGFVWSRISEADQYKIVIECRGCSSASSWKTISTQFTETNQYYFRPDLINADYRFRVLPIYSTGGGVWSDYAYFSYVR